MASIDNGASRQKDRYLQAPGEATRRYTLENDDVLIYSETAGKLLRFARV